MPPITDEHTNELEARRLRREARQASPATNGSAPAGGQAAGAARDLLRGLITDGARGDETGSAATDSGNNPTNVSTVTLSLQDLTAPSVLLTNVPAQGTPANWTYAAATITYLKAQRTEWEERICAENVGHYYEARYFSDKDAHIPTADRPDF